jgi:uncharacterized membrane protein
VRWTICVIVVALWLLAVQNSFGGSLIHAMLIVPAGIVGAQFLGGRHSHVSLAKRGKAMRSVKFLPQSLPGNRR